MTFEPDDDFRRRARVWAEQTTAAQGLPLHVTDRRVLAYIANILLQARVERESAPQPARNDRANQTFG